MSSRIWRCFCCRCIVYSRWRIQQDGRIGSGAVVKDTISPDLRHGWRKEILWIQKWLNPPWVKADLTAMIQCEAQSADAYPHLHHGSLGQESKRTAAVNEALLLIGRQSRSRGSTSFESGPSEEVNKNSSGYVRTLCKTGRVKDALHILNHPGIRADSDTYVSLLQECINMKDLREGKKVHAHIIQTRYKPNIFLLNTLVNMYAKCGSLVDARHVFDKMTKRRLLTWNIMIAGYAKHGYFREAFEMYEQMRREGVIPNRVTFICILNACASLGVLEKGKEVHEDIMKAGTPLDIVLETALVDMYAKCGSMKDASEVFNNMHQRNVVSWSAMIAGYTQCGFGREAFGMYQQMRGEGVLPDMVTFTCVLNACASLGALEKGKQVHANISRSRISPDIILDTALVDMYAKCGSTKDARQVFDKMAKRSVVSWNAMITGYAQHGGGREALRLFQQMQQEGVKPNGITFIALLFACSHVGLVDEGHHCFDSMSRDHGLTPTVEHFGCMVDLLGRAGQLKEAEDFISRMPIKPDSGVWRALLGASRIQGDVLIAERAAKSLIECDPQHPGAFVLLSNIYAATGRR